MDIRELNSVVKVSKDGIEVKDRKGVASMMDRLIYEAVFSDDERKKGMLMLVKEIANPDASVTQTGFVTGTPGFMAPEMALGKKEIDGRTDLYSLACVGFFLLTGETVFDKKTPIEIIMDHARTPAPRPSEKSGVPVPEGLEDLLMDCLAKEPRDRPDSAREVERRLWALYLPDIWTPDKAERWWAEHVSPFLPQASAHLETPRTRVEPA